MNKLFLDLHVIQTVPPSCLNRDDTGSPKTAVYGGVRRARVSSQAWKRAMRLAFRERFDAHNLGVRTKDIVAFILEQFPSDTQIDLSEARMKIIEVINLASTKADKPIVPDITYSGIKKMLGTGNNKGDTKSEVDIMGTLIANLSAKNNIQYDKSKNFKSLFEFLDKEANAISTDKKNESRMEFEKSIVRTILELEGISEFIGVETDALFFVGKQEAINIAKLTLDYMNGGSKPKKEHVQEALNYFKDDKCMRSYAVDVALFGRMVAKAPELNADASAQVAHAIGTHKIEQEFDYFTAVDDRSPDNNAGAGMIGTVEYYSSTLYRYATVAVHELFYQLASDAAATAKAAAEFACAFIDSMPDGKMNTFANRTPPDFAYICLRRDTALNLVGAFEEPVKATKEFDDLGYVTSSINALSEYATDVYNSFAKRPETAYVAALGSGAHSLGDKLSIDELPQKLTADIEAILP